MNHLLAAATVLLSAAAAVGREPPKPLAEGLTNPESVCVAPDGKVYLTTIGEFDKPGDGAVLVLDGGKFVPFASGLDDPKGLAAFQKWLFVADRDRVLRIDGNGKVEVFVGPGAFPSPPKFLNDVVVDPESGTVYVSDSGDLEGSGGAVYRIAVRGGRASGVTAVTDAARLPGLHTPNGLAMDGASHLLLADFGTGALYRVKIAGGSGEKIADGLGGADGLAWDYYGRLFIGDWKNGKVYGIPRPGEKPVLVAEGLQSAADLCYDPANNRLLVPDIKAGTLVPLPTVIPGFEVDETPLDMQTHLAFPNITWTGWSPETPDGKANVFRPIVLTHAGDGSDRIFLATQHGVVHVFPNDDAAKQTKVFLDITDRVRYDDNTNEEGFLGLAFHPRYRETGEFFVFYTPKKEKLVNVVSRFRVSKDDPDRADPDSEEEILRFTKPYWNHDGGTICFGPDGMLYITHGDGGAANDPHDNGQNLNSLLGKVLRIDIDRKDAGRNYAIPNDNPFAGKNGARPEIWAYGLRNVWRMAFDRKTGKLWAADVGQNLYEEVNIIDRGGNYGWNRRESFHPFGPKGVGVNKDMIDPIWEYHHDVGKSITGGSVYRGKKLPELDGHYIYGDYVTTKIWALKYDEAKGRVVANRPIKDRGRPILSFGEDESGEVYLLTTASDGKGVFRFSR
jgi:glucose/arabinose dehydrogenase/sugar lactone lactonase YvrE